MFTIIAGVNVHNEYWVNDIAGIAGYAGSVELIDETTRKIDLLNDIERSDIGINNADILLMFKAFIEMGFKISLHQ
ncbi:TPA: hypothetical protein G7138_003468 [Salmonella enterica subsp. enterica serovar Typhi]|uniref:Uncharacterized protein n=1 Tax=Salmonella typhi TaxID=90370 RepID=A0A748DPX0_SALTI|nr:hypothetical protein [Salmonella enterica subsp. enterica]HAF4992533.1 hypothetical protein [Salmonella enterica subsp. enterica serovar Typhi]HAF5001308.1 hypothetical protein [Salmonella enterica subsp. enterica serovar Typhi]HAF6813851.1 hypothetical protein [Salmonella enterica subsp. enterica serovar Typhi]